MKKSIFILAVLAISIIACAQKPPGNAEQNFHARFKSATKVKWDQEEKNEFL